MNAVRAERVVLGGYLATLLFERVGARFVQATNHSSSVIPSMSPASSSRASCKSSSTTCTRQP
jgi:hypothetical protein